MDKRYQAKYNIKAIKKIGIFLVCSILFMTIGFSAFSAELGIKNLSAVVRVEKIIRITSVSVGGSASGAVSNWEDYNTNSVSSSISLPNSNSTITYNVKVTNLGNIEAALEEITGLPDNLTYTINNYNLEDLLCDDTDHTQCTLGSTTTLSITVGYKANGYNSSNTDYTIGMDFNFMYQDEAVAQMDYTLYPSVQAAVNNVVANGPQKTIILLNDSSEVVTIAAGKDIILNLGNKTLSNNGNANVIINNGTLELRNGSIVTDAEQGAINNNNNATIWIENVNMTAGVRQALYNDRGTATITGSTYITSNSNQRAPVQNQSGGTLTILSGTIISNNFPGVVNAGTMTIGAKDGVLSTTSPSIRGLGYGIDTSANFNFYDGIIKGTTDPVSSITRIADTETGKNPVSGEETINNVLYNTMYLGIANKVTFNPNGGSVTNGVKYIATGQVVGTLPVPTRGGHSFIGWYTDRDTGTEVTANTVINNEVTFWAHWNQITDVVRIGNTYYNSLQEAINAVDSNTPATITLLKNNTESVNFPAGKTITLDLNGYSINNSSTRSVIDNYGNTTIINGNISSNANAASIDNRGGHLTLSNNLRIVSTGTRQAVYIYDGTVEITGNAYLSSQTSGKPSGSSMERGTVQCTSTGTLIITGGTIEGLKQQAVSNEGTLRIGTKDGSIDTTTPILLGKAYGLKTTGTFNFYDGIIKGKTAAINGTVSDIETNSQIANGTEIIDNTNYKTQYLVSTS